MTLPYHIISYLMFFYFISSADLISILFYSILFYFISNRLDLIWFYSILFYSIEFDLLYCSVLYLISMNDLCLSICPSVCLLICINKFLFSISYLFSLFFLFSLFSFLLNVFLTHTHMHMNTHTRARTHTYIWIYVPSYDSYILLQQYVSEESYSSDSIISYLI